VLPHVFHAPPPLLQANAAYAADFGDKASLALPPARRAAFLTCMVSFEAVTLPGRQCRGQDRLSAINLACLQDARIDTGRTFGIKEGDAHVIRNAGGRASDDAIRSFVISHKLLGTTEWFVVHHTDCGMEYFTSEQLGELLTTSRATAAFDGEAKAFKNVTHEGGAPDGKYINFLTIKDQATSIKEDVARIAAHALTAPGIPIHGYLYDVKTGKLGHVVSAVTTA